MKTFKEFITEARADGKPPSRREQQPVLAIAKKLFKSPVSPFQLDSIEKLASSDKNIMLTYSSLSKTQAEFLRDVIIATVKELRKGKR